MKIYLGADHRGYHLKEKIAKWLFENGYNFEDMGANYLDPSDDYTFYAEKVASVVGGYYSKAKIRSNEMRGILLCGSGVGVDITANKFDGVRASVGKSVEQVKAGRKDDDMNVLVLASDFTKEREAVKMVGVFLETVFDSKKKHKDRLEEIERIERNN